jgi:hypothetical protein
MGYQLSKTKALSLFDMLNIRIIYVVVVLPSKKRFDGTTIFIEENIVFNQITYCE